nr:transglycosylase SLT domain protein [uncultured Mediterranean phage uvMED]
MPKIPTFTTQARPTAEAPSIQSKTQIPLSQTIGTALAPVTKAITEHAVNEKNLENKSEALSLENKALLELTDVFDKASRLDNKDEAFNIVQNESKIIQETYSNRASNNSVKSSFNNNFLAEVQKGIFKVNNRVSTNIIQTLDNEVSVKRNRLLTAAYVDKDPLALSLIQTDLETLYEQTYKGRIDTDEYNKLIQGIPGEIQIFEVSQLISSNPRQAYSDLMNKDKFVDLDLNKRVSLISEVKSVLIPEIKDEYKNLVAAAAFGKDVPFDIKFAKEILPPKTFNNMMKEYSNVKDTVADVKILNTTSNKNLSETLDNMLSKREQSKTFIEYQKEKKILVEAVNARNEAMASDPVFFLNATNDNIKVLSEELQNENNPDLKLQKKKALTEIYVETQLNMGQPPYQIKVMSNSESTDFVERYVNGDQNMRIAMLQNLDAEFGDYNSNAMLQLTNAGLPVTAELSSFFNNPKLTERFLSFDSKDEQDRLKQYAKDNNITFNDVRKSIRDNLSEFEDVVMRGSRFNTSVALDKMDNIVDVLSYYALNEMVAGESQGSAEKNAYNLINNSFEIQDTFFVPLVYNGKSITSSADFIVEKANLIKDFYVEDFGAVAFESVDEDVTDIELNEAMKDQLKNFGEWRNSADGTGIVYGIVFNDGSFGPVKNQEGEYLSFNFDNTSLTIPGTDKEMDLDIRTKSQQLQPRRGYPAVSESVSKLQANKGSEIIGKRR